MCYCDDGFSNEDTKSGVAFCDCPLGQKRKESYAIEREQDKQDEKICKMAEAAMDSYYTDAHVAVAQTGVTKKIVTVKDINSLLSNMERGDILDTGRATLLILSKNSGAVRSVRMINVETKVRYEMSYASLFGILKGRCVTARRTTKNYSTLLD